jgi:SAM-dependent methyltransferase
MQHSDASADSWEGAHGYEHFMGRWSRELARHFVRWLGVPAGGHWLEVGCGTGALTSAICELGRPATVVATEPSQQFLALARASLPDPRVRFLEAGVGQLPTRAAGYDAVVSALVLNFLPDSAAALREMRSLTREGGVVAACVWDYAGGMELLRRFWDAAVELDSAARELDEGARFPLCDPAALRAAFLEAGFRRAEVDALDVATPFVDFEDYWQPFLGGAGPAPSYVSRLRSDRRGELAARLERTLPRDPDGSIRLTGRAWAIRAVVPSAA